MFLKKDGTVWGAGYNADGQLGNGSTANQTSLVQAASGMVALSASANNSFSFDSTGVVYGWGWNAFGAVGDGSTSTIKTPLQIFTTSLKAFNDYPWFKPLFKFLAEVAGILKTYKNGFWEDVV